MSGRSLCECVPRVSRMPHRRRRQRSSLRSRSRWRRLDLMLSKSRSRFRRRLKTFETRERRSGPRPSQRPSRASWQLTNLEHLLSKRRDALRPRPWPIASVATLTTINRLNMRIPNSFLCFIGSLPEKHWPMRFSGPQWATIASSFMPLPQPFGVWVIMFSYQSDFYGNR